ncbi:MAG: hypothetical protein K6G83_07175, partial [Lachnospiraceae bacterium]|nr:hypothetical protein [Lachnospiraceae bacterium]
LFAEAPCSGSLSVHRVLSPGPYLHLLDLSYFLPFSSSSIIADFVIFLRFLYIDKKIIAKNMVTIHGFFASLTERMYYNVRWTVYDIELLTWVGSWKGST